MEKKLKFVEKNGVWESEEFHIDQNFNVHAERNGVGRFRLLQKTAGTEFADVISDLPCFHLKVVDVDVEVLIPKTFKIVSTVQITQAFYTTAV